MAVICKNCGGPHPIWECKKPMKKSGATQKKAGRFDSGSLTEIVVKEGVRVPPAGKPGDAVAQRVMGRSGRSERRPTKSSSGGSSTVERRPSKSDVAGSTPARRSNKSTAARKDVRTVRKVGPLRQTKANTVSSESPAQVSEIGTSNGKNRGTAGIKPRPSIKKKGPGRPSTGFDKAAYMRDYMRRYRAKKSKKK